jgi:alkylation response protein AidB-like acyl-CoA dehydrogenase
MDFSFTEEQRHWVAVARKFAVEKIRPRARELDRVADPAATFPIDLIREASRLGLRTLKIPKEYGGAGVDCLTEVLVQEELTAGDIGFGMTLQHAWREGHILASGTTDAQRERFLKPFLEDDTALLAFAITEEHAGSDHKSPYYETLEAGLQCRAVRDGDSWVINGAKKWQTNANVAKFVILAARTNPDVPWPQGMSFFVVPTDTPGFRIDRVLDKLGIRLNQNGDMSFHDCRIPADNLLGEVDRGRHFIHRFSAGSSAKEAAKAIGIARAALEAAIAFGKQRIQGGKPIIQHQAIGQTISDLAMEIEMARTLTWRAAWAVDHAPADVDRLESMAKIAASEVCVRTAMRSLEIFGGQGILRDQPIEKLARDALCMMHTGAGNHAVRVRLATMLTGEKSLGDSIY